MGATSAPKLKCAHRPETAKAGAPQDAPPGPTQDKKFQALASGHRGRLVTLGFQFQAPGLGDRSCFTLINGLIHIASKWSQTSRAQLFLILPGKANEVAKFFIQPLVAIAVKMAARVPDRH